MPALLRYFAFVLLLPQCGAAAATGAEPQSSAARASSTDPNTGSSQANEDGDERGADAPTTDAPQGPSCEDGTCSKCGSGICPAGWYCDESATGDGACSWLTECAGKPSCSCVTRVLGSACKCREEDGGLKVACD